VAITKEQQDATRKLERAQDDWLRAYGWVRELGGRWTHPSQPMPCSHFDAMALTRAQPLLFGASTLRSARQ